KVDNEATTAPTAKPPVWPRRDPGTAGGPGQAASPRPRHRRGAQVEALVGGLLRGDAAAGGEQPAGEGVLRRAVDRLDAEQPAAGIAEGGELAAFGVAAQDDAVVPGGEPGDLQAQVALLAPEPRQRLVGVRLAEQPVGDAAGVVGGVLYRLEPGRAAIGVTAGERGAIADRRDRRIGGQQPLVDDDAVGDGKPAVRGKLGI